jgi:predicted RNA-binding Zn ribbon-like protein
MRIIGYATKQARSQVARRANPFDWSGGHPALDLVNTLDERPSGAPVENLATYGDLERFAELAGLIERSGSDRLRPFLGRKCAYIARRARELRENLYRVLAAAHLEQNVPKASLDGIASEVRRAHAARALVATSASGTIKHGWLSPSALEIPLHACALAVEALLVNIDHSLIRKCSASDCDVFFIDTSKAHRRQWCSMQNCGNREKQRRWRSGVE